MTVHDRARGERIATAGTPADALANNRPNAMTNSMRDTPSVATRDTVSIGSFVAGHRSTCSAWSAAAHCVGLDTCTVVGDSLAAMVGVVGIAARHDRRDATDLSVDQLSSRSASPNELLVSGLQELELSDDPVNDVVALIAAVHDETRDRNRVVPSAATITVVVRDGATIAIVHVGDATAVQLRHGALAQLTPLSRCHTLAADLRAAGRQPNARADTVVTRVVGGHDDLIIDVTKVPIEPGRTSYVVVAHPPSDLVELVDAAGRSHSANEALDSICAVLPADTAAIVVEVRSPAAGDDDADSDVDHDEDPEVDRRGDRVADGAVGWAR